MQAIIKTLERLEKNFQTFQNDSMLSDRYRQIAGKKATACKEARQILWVAFNEEKGETK